MTTGVLRLRKQDPASRWLDRDRYAVDRLNAIAPDGKRVPITIVYRKEMRHLVGNPTLIVGYGAYGSSLRATFRPSVFSLIDRGFVYAIAHVRGGHEKGERWYAEGRVLNKRNTFTDFIAATEMLIAQGYADPRAVFAQGGSAGGLLMGAIANLRPDLYAGIVAERHSWTSSPQCPTPRSHSRRSNMTNGAIQPPNRNTTTCFPIRPTTMFRGETILQCSSPQASTTAR